MLGAAALLAAGSIGYNVYEGGDEAPQAAVAASKTGVVTATSASRQERRDRGADTESLRVDGAVDCRTVFTCSPE